MMNRRFILSAVSLCLALPSAIAQSPSIHIFHHENVLGTSLELKVKTRTDAEAQRAETAVLKEIDRENEILSAWSSTSEFSRWVRTQGKPDQALLGSFATGEDARPFGDMLLSVG